MNSIKSMAILFFALFSPTIIAQESFLQLDSIVVIEEELNVSTNNSNQVNIGRDTIDITVGSNQYVKLRKVSFSMRSTQAISFSSYTDVSIGTTTNLYLNLASSMLKWSIGTTSSSSNFRVEYLDPKSIKLETFPDEFLTEIQEVFVQYDNRFDPNIDLYYRIELVYYSYE